MKEKLEQSLSREELAQQLESLAAQLRSGTLGVEGTRWALPDDFELRVALKEKRGQIRCKLEWRCSTLEGYASEDAAAVTRWRSSVKEAKRAMARRFKVLKQAAASEGLPDEAAILEFEQVSSAFLELAEPEWRPAMAEFMGHLENLRTASRLGHGEMVRHELQDLEARMVACHRDLR